MNNSGLQIFIVLTVIVKAKAYVMSGSELPVVSTPDGPIRGTVLQSRDSRSYNAFRGIKYGTVARRFELSKPVAPWTEVLDATRFGPICPQPGNTGSDVADATEVSEDCLYLNVYVPETIESAFPFGPQPQDAPKYAVMFFIHGGGWFRGAGSDHGADFFMDEDVILVTINYRLGVLGFLDFDDGTIPSNNGLKDIVLALKWVQRNIGAFGGDPKKVTLFGDSTGAAAAHFLSICVAADGLFRGAIIQSGAGTAISRVAMFSESANGVKERERARTLAQKLGCIEENTEEIVEFLRERDIKDLFEAQALIPNGLTAFRPSGDRYRCKSDEDDYWFFPWTPTQILLHSHNKEPISLMMGYDETEGNLKMASHLVTNETFVREAQERWPSLSAQLSSHNVNIPFELATSIIKAVRQVYLNEKTDPADQDPAMEHIKGMVRQAATIKYNVQLHAYLGDKIYEYVFTYKGEYSLARNSAEELQGLALSDELQYLFPWPNNPYGMPPLVPGSSDEEFSRKLVKLWSSFAADGVPTAMWADKWQPYAMENIGQNDYPVMWLGSDAEFVTQRCARLEDILPALQPK